MMGFLQHDGEMGWNLWSRGSWKFFARLVLRDPVEAGSLAAVGCVSRSICGRARLLLPCETRIVDGNKMEVSDITLRHCELGQTSRAIIQIKYDSAQRSGRLRLRPHATPSTEIQPAAIVRSPVLQKSAKPSPPFIAAISRPP
jgi:hypothetical protein